MPIAHLILLSPGHFIFNFFDPAQTHEIVSDLPVQEGRAAALQGDLGDAYFSRIPMLIDPTMPSYTLSTLEDCAFKAIQRSTNFLRRNLVICQNQLVLIY